MANVKCKIVGKEGLDRLMLKYCGMVGGELTSDERELLLFALYIESRDRGGIGAKPTARLDAQVAEQKAKLDAIIAAEAEQERNRREPNG